MEESGGGGGGVVLLEIERRVSRYKLKKTKRFA